MEELNFRTLYEGNYKDYPRPPSKKTGDLRTRKPVVNIEKCCQCGWCYLYCLIGCVEDKGTYFEPNLDYCKGCGVCAKECPKSAIEMVNDERG